MVWYEMKKYPEVLNDYSEVIRIDSNYIYAYYNRAMLRAEVGEKNAAIRDLDKVVEMTSSGGEISHEVLFWFI